jgi:hypothetical protein
MQVGGASQLDLAPPQGVPVPSIRIRFEGRWRTCITLGGGLAHRRFATHQLRLAMPADDRAETARSGPVFGAFGHRWPFVGRSVELEAVVAAYHDRDVSGVVVVGPAGVGENARRRVGRALSRRHSAMVRLRGRPRIGDDYSPWPPPPPSARGPGGRVGWRSPKRGRGRGGRRASRRRNQPRRGRPRHCRRRAGAAA